MAGHDFVATLDSGHFYSLPKSLLTHGIHGIRTMNIDDIHNNVYIWFILQLF